MKLILALPAVGLLFSGLTIAPSHLPVPTSSTPAPAPQLRVDRKECFKDESFQLFFNLPHGTSLGVVNPDGKFFYLVFPEACTTGKLKPLVSSELFADMDRLTITPAVLRADPYEFGVEANRPVFTKSGVYRFILGDNLHVDDESQLNVVSIRYWHKKRPGSTEMLN